MPRLLFGKFKTLPSVVGALSTFLVKKYGLVLNNPVISARENFTSLLLASCEFICAVIGKWGFSTADHVRAVKGERCDGKKDRDITNDSKL